MKILSCLFLSLVALSLQAQPEPDEYFSVTLNALPEAHKTLVFGDKINVRKAPLKDAAVVAQLRAGDDVEITRADTTQLEINGWTASWCKVAFTQNGKRAEGYAWGGLLSPIPLKTADVSFVYGVTGTKSTKHKDPEGYEYETSESEVELRAVRNGQVLSSTRFRGNVGGGYETQAYVYDALGVPGYKNLVKIEVFFPACGYSSYEFWSFWDGKALTPLPLLSGFSDAGAVHESESYIFPAVEGGIEGKILYLYELDQGMEMDGEYDYEKHIRPMVWDGKKFSKPELPK